MQSRHCRLQPLSRTGLPENYLDMLPQIPDAQAPARSSAAAQQDALSAVPRHVPIKVSLGHKSCDDKHGPCSSLSQLPPSPGLLGSRLPAGIITGDCGGSLHLLNWADTGEIRSAAPGASGRGEAAPSRASLALIPIKGQGEPLQLSRGGLLPAAAAPDPRRFAALWGVSKPARNGSF